MAKNFNISWTVPTSDGGSPITSYDVGYTPSGSGETIVSTASASSSYVLAGLTDGVEYSVRVRAVNAAGAGPWSDPVVQLAAVVPYAPTNLDSIAGDTELSLSWDAPTNDGGSAITEYIIRYTPDGQSPVTVETNSTSTSFTLTGLTNDTLYTIEVAAINIIGTGSYSTSTSDTPISVATGSTELLLNFDNNLTDDGPNTYTITGSSVLYDTTNKTFGSASMYGGSLSASSADAGTIINSMSGDFTVEFWACYDYGASNGALTINMDGGPYEWGGGIFVNINGQGLQNWVELYDDENYYDTSAIIMEVIPLVDFDYDTSTVIPVLKHIAIVRSGTDISIYSDGSRVANFTGPLNIQAGTKNYFMVDAGISNTLWMDSLRISSAALYSGASFTVPTSPLS